MGDDDGGGAAAALLLLRLPRLLGFSLDRELTAKILRETAAAAAAAALALAARGLRPRSGIDPTTDHCCPTKIRSVSMGTWLQPSRRASERGSPGARSRLSSFDCHLGTEAKSTVNDEKNEPAIAVTLEIREGPCHIATCHSMSHTHSSCPRVAQSAHH